MGCLLPFMTLWFEGRGMNEQQIGYLFSASALSVFLTPVLLTWIADAHVAPRRLLTCIYIAVGATLGFLLEADSFWTILPIWTLHGLAIAPLMPLQDGMFFARSDQMAAEQVVPPAYHRVRVWGTIGFITGGSVLAAVWWLLRSHDMNYVLFGAIIGCAVGLVNSLFLPPAPKAVSDASKKMPTIEALRSITERHLLVYCLGMWFVHLACAAYYGFHPLYLTKLVGIDEKWVGMIMNIGVGIEVFFMLSFGWFVKRIGLRGLVILGAVGMILRFALMAIWPNVFVAILAQGFHGLMVLIVHVAPPIYLNRHADASYRNSIQGVFSMLVGGSGRIAGGLIAGWIATRSITMLFFYAAGVSAVGVLLFFFAFDKRDEAG